MSFTLDKFVALSRENRIKKVLYSIKEFLNNKKEKKDTSELLEWFKKYEQNDLSIPLSNKEWEQLYNKLLELLFLENPYLEMNVFDKDDTVRKTIEYNVICDNIRSPYNIGSIMRTGESFGLSEIVLCGISPTPDKNSKVLRTSRDVNLKYSFFNNTKEAIVFFRKKGFFIYALEKTNNSSDINIFEFKAPFCLIIGNEEFGISKDVLDLCDDIIHVNMFGVKNSLNVSVAASIAMFQISNLFF